MKQEAIPTETLSSHFSDRLSGHRVLAAVFTTYTFDPAFFEQEIIPVLVDVTVSHVAKVRLVQLEDELMRIPEGVSVYYDRDGLRPSDQATARLGVARLPIKVQQGCFHPKNVFILAESKDPDEHGVVQKKLLVGCSSANLTRGGWWENVEACHVEELEAGTSSWLRSDLLPFLRRLPKLSPPELDHRPLEAIVRFLERETSDRSHRSSAGRLHTRIWAKAPGVRGASSLVAFLQEAYGRELRDMRLEVLSPYFDDGDEGSRLAEIVDAFAPRHTRIFLPTAQDGAALAPEKLDLWMRTRDDVAWGKLPADTLASGTSADAMPRCMHAKMLRFFDPSAKREIVVVGSPNLTKAGHHHPGNAECAFVVDVPLTKRPDFWMAPVDTIPRTFTPPPPPEDAPEERGSALAVRLRWGHPVQGSVYWDERAASPRLELRSAGVPLFALDSLAPRTWIDFEAEQSTQLADAVRHTALLQIVVAGEEPATILVAEEGTLHRPAILFSLSAADILHYWSLLTPAQRAAYLEARARDLALTAEGALLPKLASVASTGSMFDRVAGVFHAFSMLERAVREALDTGHDRDAAYRLFGQKYDALGTLLRHVGAKEVSSAEVGIGDPTHRYLVALCAKQLLNGIEREHPEFWRAHAQDSHEVRRLLDTALGARDEVLLGDPQRAEFLEWFDGHFLAHERRPAVEA